MKKLFISLFIAIVSLVSIYEIKADTVLHYSYSFISRFTSRDLNSVGACRSTSANSIILIYEFSVGDTVPSFELIGSSQFIIYGYSPTSSCGSYSTSGYVQAEVIYYPSVGNTYSFNQSVDYFHEHSELKYVFIGLSSSSSSISWGSGSEVIESVVESGNDLPVDDSDVPEVEISTTDYYLFFDFDTISDFDVFSDYSFTGFTDYEKLMFTLVINIFYLGFIGFCIYIVLKGLNKMFSWVFR